MVPLGPLPLYAITSSADALLDGHGRPHRKYNRWAVSMPPPVRRLDETVDVNGVRAMAPFLFILSLRVEFCLFFVLFRILDAQLTSFQQWVRHTSFSLRPRRLAPASLSTLLKLTRRTLKWIIAMGLNHEG